MTAKRLHLRHDGVETELGKTFWKSGLLNSLACVTEEECGIFFEGLGNCLVPPPIFLNWFNCMWAGVVSSQATQVSVSFLRSQAGIYLIEHLGNGNPLQYPCLENIMDRGAWWLIASTIWTFVGKVMSLLFNTLSWFVIAFLPRSKCLLISWLQSPSSVILEPKKIKFLTVSTFSPSICHEMMRPGAMILVFWMVSFKPTFSLSSFT